MFNRKKGVARIAEVNQPDTAMVDGAAMIRVRANLVRLSETRIVKTRRQLTGTGVWWKQSPQRSS